MGPGRISLSVHTCVRGRHRVRETRPGFSAECIGNGKTRMGIFKGLKGKDAICPDTRNSEVGKIIG